MATTPEFTAGVMAFLGIKQSKLRWASIDLFAVAVEAAAGGQESARSLLAFLGAKTVADVEWAIREMKRELEERNIPTEMEPEPQEKRGCAIGREWRILEPQGGDQHWYIRERIDSDGTVVFETGNYATQPSSYTKSLHNAKAYASKWVGKVSWGEVAN